MLDFSTGGAILERFEALKSNRSEFDSLWQEVADHVLGMRSFNTTYQPGQKRTQNIYDTTAMTAGNQLAGVFHGVLTNPSSRWNFLASEDPAFVPNQEEKAWIDHTDAVLQHIFRRGEYGFIPAIAETYRDDVFFGNSDIFVEDVPGRGIRFEAVPLCDLYIDESQMGQVDLFFRHRKLTLRQAVQRFGDKALGDKIMRRYEKDPTATIEIVSLIHERREAKGGPDLPHPWRSVEVLVEEKKILREKGYWSRPHHVSRMTKDTGELYGRGPAINALSSAKTLNEIMKTYLKTAQKLADPPLLQAHEGILTQLDTSPGSLTIAEGFAFDKNPVRPLIENFGQTVVTDKLLAIMQFGVKQHFLGDALDAIMQQYMTATQTIEISEVVAQRLLSPISRIQVEKIEPMLMRVLDVVERGGMTPPRPQSLQGAPIRARFLSPVERTQRASEMRAIVQSYTTTAQLAAINPDVFDNYDSDESARLLGDLSGIPPQVMRSIEERDDIREIRAEREQAQAQQAQMQEGIDSASKLLPALAKVQSAQAA